MNTFEFWEQHHELLRSGRAFVLVVLTETLGSAPQETGAKMLCDSNGWIAGTVGGGKVEAKALDQAATMLNSNLAYALVDWHLEKDVGMTCGGRVKIYFETHGSARWQIAIFGAGHVAQAVVRTLLPLDCEITCVDSRTEWLESFPKSSKLIPVRREQPSEFVATLNDSTFVLLMTQGHATDFPVLLECMRTATEFPYLGVIGSKSKRTVLHRELLNAGVSENRAEKFICPIGLPLGANTPAEIAISVVAQLIEVRDKYSVK
jgi:xanthine dehydrogenase accessory factor